MTKSKTTKKVRGRDLTVGTTLATGEKVLTRTGRDYFGSAGTRPWSVISVTLDGGPDGKGGIIASYGPSEWVEVQR